MAYFSQIEVIGFENTERLTRQFNYRSSLGGALIPAAGAPTLLDFSGTATTFTGGTGNFVSAKIQNRTNRDIIVYDSSGHGLVYVSAGTTEDITGILYLNGITNYPQINVARASGGAATGLVYLNLVYSTTSI